MKLNADKDIWDSKIWVCGKNSIPFIYSNTLGNINLSDKKYHILEPKFKTHEKDFTENMLVDLI